MGDTGRGASLGQKLQKFSEGKAVHGKRSRLVGECGVETGGTSPQIGSIFLVK